MTLSVEWQGQGELSGLEASLFCKCSYSVGSRRCSMDQHFSHLPWFFPKGRAVVYICAHVDICIHGLELRPTGSPGHEKSMFPGGAGLTLVQRGQGPLSREGARWSEKEQYPCAFIGFESALPTYRCIILIVVWFSTSSCQCRRRSGLCRCVFIKGQLAI